MSLQTRPAGHLALCLCGLTALMFGLASAAKAQTGPYERSFPQPKAKVEKALAALQSGLSGHLPVLDGFAKPGDHPLERYQRGFYQSIVQVSSASSGGSVVRITTKVTAWYADPSGSHSGYQLLTSNGRIEADLFDQLSDQLAKDSTAPFSRPETAATVQPSEPPATAVPATAPSAAVPSSATPSMSSPPSNAQPEISAPAPRFPDTDKTFSSSVTEGLAKQIREGDKDAASPAEKSNRALEKEASNLEEIVRNIAQPKNLVAVKKSGTPVVSTPSLTAKPQFLASLHDEFELLDFNADWVHVRISGLSRGWIWRNSVEMPDGIADTQVRPAAAQNAAADMFKVTREESSTFPGDWGPLKNKNVKIISVQKVDENSKDASPQERLEYAKFLLEKGYREVAQKSPDLAGIVVIFDSVDGGMVAATMPALQLWKAGKLSDAALWHQCFFDPPETFDSTAPGGQ